MKDIPEIDFTEMRKADKTDNRYHIVVVIFAILHIVSSVISYWFWDYIKNIPLCSNFLFCVMIAAINDLNKDLDFSDICLAQCIIIPINLYIEYKLFGHDEDSWIGLLIKLFAIVYLIKKHIKYRKQLSNLFSYTIIMAVLTIYAICIYKHDFDKALYLSLLSDATYSAIILLSIILGKPVRMRKDFILQNRDDNRECDGIVMYEENAGKGKKKKKTKGSHRRH